jgi:elongation factor 1-beta
MGIALFQIKVMPESPEFNLEEIKNKAEKNISNLTGKITGFEERPIAFGLKALIVSIRISEDIDGNKIEEALKSIEGVSSIDIIDYRRAIN